MDINTPEGMLQNCYYTDIKTVDESLAAKIIQALKPLIEDYIPLHVRLCGSFTWIDLPPFVLIWSKKYPAAYNVFEARVMGSEEIKEAINSIRQKALEGGQ